MISADRFSLSLCGLTAKNNFGNLSSFCFVTEFHFGDLCSFLVFTKFCFLNLNYIDFSISI